MRDGWHAVMPLEELPDGAMREVRVGHEPILLARQGGDVFAASPLCPHKYTDLTEGRLQGRHLTCPLHAATFDLGTGRPGPGQEWAGLLPTVPVRVREGMVEVRLP